MKAIDTNVLLRLIVGDDLEQEAAARAFVEAEPSLVSLTVAMESEWVLRSYYKLTPDQIANALDEMTAFESLTFEDIEGVRWALDRLRAGADFADMIHILRASALDATAFVTFDTGLADEAGIAPPLTVRILA